MNFKNEKKFMSYLSLIFKRLRTAKNFSQESICLKSCSRGTIAKLENGNLQSFNIDFANDIAIDLDLPLDEITVT